MLMFKKIIFPSFGFRVRNSLIGVYSNKMGTVGSEPGPHLISVPCFARGEEGGGYWGHWMNGFWSHLWPHLHSSPLRNKKQGLGVSVKPLLVHSSIHSTITYCSFCQVHVLQKWESHNPHLQEVHSLLGSRRATKSFLHTELLETGMKHYGVLKGCLSLHE